MNGYSLLSLGDSYTIGEQVAIEDNFPNQIVSMLRQAGLNFSDPEIVAKTGWTTDELQEGINQRQFKFSYDFVTLLIGVNNQYRGRPVDNYKIEFESLLKQAIKFAGGKADHVAVLSIPDWGITPFAKDRDHKKIAEEIDVYNSANKKIASMHHVHYIDITLFTREAASDSSLLTTDGLHPSGKDYQRWAEKVAEWIRGKF